MRHKFTMSLTLTATIGTALMLGACASDPLMPSKSETYSRDFIKTFGVFDQKHDWNHATQASVTVTSATPTDVKIYADVDGTRYLFGTYLGVSGSKALNVDIPKGTTQLIVNANGKNYTVDAGGKVSLSAGPSRIVWENGPDGQRGPFNVSISENRIFRTPEEVLRYREYLPETKNNIGKVAQDFMFVSNGPFYIYPAYYQTDQYLTNIMGLYYYDDSGKLVTQDFFKLGGGNLMTYTNQEKYTKSETTLYSYLFYNNKLSVPSGSKEYANFTDKDWEYVREQMRNGELYFDNTDFKIFSEFNYTVDSSQNCATITGEYKKFSPVYGANGNESIPTDATELAFQGIKVDIPAGTKFGLYLKLESKMGQPDWGIDPDHTYFFSDSELNTDYLWTPKEGSDVTTRDEANSNPDGAEYFGADHATPKPAVHAATFTRSDGMIRLCFEDWYNNTGFTSDFDLNDMVFYITGVQGIEENPDVIPDDPEPDQPEPFEWIIACEDLGAVDFDFNDIVFSVSNPVVDEDGNKTVNITALAAGGTLPVYILYNDKILTPEGTDNGEFHAWFEGNHSSTTVINANSVRAKGITYTLPVAEDFTMACCMTVTGEGNSGNMGGFKVMVEHTDNPVIISATNPNIDKELGSAPQMICVPGTWQWPTETTHILDVYEDFKKWCENGYDHNTYLWHERLTGTGYWKR